MKLKGLAYFSISFLSPYSPDVAHLVQASSADTLLSNKERTVNEQEELFNSISWIFK